MTKLSVICPFVNEYPQVYFTLANLVSELDNTNIDYEIIAIDNICDEVRDQIVQVRSLSDNTIKFINELPLDKEKIRELNSLLMQDVLCEKRGEDKGSERVKGRCLPHPRLKYITFDKKLSHWQAKNEGIKNSTGDVLFFIDSHCILSCGTLEKMFRYYTTFYEDLNGTLHMPLTYMLEVPGAELVYKLVTDEDKGVVHYSFTRYKIRDKVYKAPCMSTCGMMMSREIYDLLGGWPEELGIYGGGENFINFTLAILGKDINIFNSKPLHHYAEKRGYHWNYTDYHRNRSIATYMFGGEEWLKRYVFNIKGRQNVLEFIFNEVKSKCMVQRSHIKRNQKLSIEDWLLKWR